MKNANGDPICIYLEIHAPSIISKFVLVAPYLPCSIFHNYSKQNQHGWLVSESPQGLVCAVTKWQNSSSVWNVSVHTSHVKILLKYRFRLGQSLVWLSLTWSVTAVPRSDCGVSLLLGALVWFPRPCTSRSSQVTSRFWVTDNTLNSQALKQNIICLPKLWTWIFHVLFPIIHANWQFDCLLYVF